MSRDGVSILQSKTTIFCELTSICAGEVTIDHGEVTISSN